MGLKTNLRGKGCHKCTFVGLGRLFPWEPALSPGQAELLGAGAVLWAGHSGAAPTAGSHCCPRQDCTGALERLLEVMVDQNLWLLQV